MIPDPVAPALVPDLDTEGERLTRSFLRANLRSVARDDLRDWGVCEPDHERFRSIFGHSTPLDRASLRRAAAAGMPLGCLAERVLNADQMPRFLELRSAARRAAGAARD